MSCGECASHVQDNDNDDAEWRIDNESRQHESGRLCFGLAQVTRAKLHAGHVRSVSPWMCVCGACHTRSDRTCGTPVQKDVEYVSFPRGVSKTYDVLQGRVVEREDVCVLI